MLYNYHRPDIAILLCAGFLPQASTQKATPQVITIPFEKRRFDISGRAVTFETLNGVKVMKIEETPTGETVPVTLKDLNFTNGSIEFDALPSQKEPDDQIGIKFHQKDIYNHESLYLRFINSVPLAELQTKSLSQHQNCRLTVCAFLLGFGW